MIVARDIDACRAARADMGSVALVPTMGALHDGHLSLMHRAGELADHVAVSIFVNPAQFNEQDDLARYPRPVERDLELCRDAGVDLVFHPQVDVIYPPDELDLTIDVPAMTETLEGAHRPGHFVGVCRVVTKLFNIVSPDFACFGLKDYQQLAVIAAMTRGMNLPIEIVPCPTIRDADGMAMSSRNVRLDAEERRRGLGLRKALLEARRLIADGVMEPHRVEEAMDQALRAHELVVEYAVVRDARTLGRIDLIDTGRSAVVCLIAARVGSVRLIDNEVIGPAS